MKIKTRLQKPITLREKILNEVLEFKIIVALILGLVVYLLWESYNKVIIFFIVAFIVLYLLTEVEKNEN